MLMRIRNGASTRLAELEELGRPVGKRVEVNYVILFFFFFDFL